MLTETDFNRVVEVSKALGYAMAKTDVLTILESLTMKDFCNPDKVEAYNDVRVAMMNMVLTK